MYLVLTLAGVAFLLSFVLTPIVRNVFRMLGIVDQPDVVRKRHVIAVPRVGGISIVLAYVSTFFIALYGPISFSYEAVVKEAMPHVWALFPAIITIFVTGLLDDLMGLKPWQKLIGQLCAGCLAVSSGVRITLFADQQLSHLWSIPLTLFWLILCTNAFNLIDGLDGLAAGVGTFATVTVLVAAVSFDNIGLAIVTAPLAGCLIGFLRYNFSPASVFLGDCGSLLIGFVLGMCSVLWSQKATTALGMTAPLMAIAIPLLDVALSVLRRYLRKQPIFQGDRGHIHHRLLDRGITPKAAVLLIYACCACAAAFSILQTMVYTQAGGLVVLLFGVVVWIGLQHLGYVEFNLARELLFQGTFRNLIDGRTKLILLEQELLAASNVEECWTLVSHASAEFGFSGLTLHVGNTDIYSAPVSGGRDEHGWVIQVPLTHPHHIQFRRASSEPGRGMLLPEFIYVVTTALRTKLLQIEEHNQDTPARNHMTAAAGAKAAAALELRS